MTSHFLSVGASPTIALRGELAPGHSSLKDIAGAAAEAEQQAIQRALEITMGEQERGGSAPPDRLQNSAP